jgi:hypothetical protein
MATPRKTASTESGTEQAPTEESAAKKSPARKAPAKRKPAKKAPAKKSASASGRTSAPRAEARAASDSSHDQDGAPEPKQAKKVPAMKVARTAAQQLSQLTGRAPECVVGVQRTDDGWQVDLEVVESRRIPDSTDILAIYRVETDEDGDLTGYHRMQRYVRGKGGDGGER